MLPVRYANYEIDAEPFLQEAFAALPFINPSHHALFAGFFQQHWNTRDLERVLRKAGMPADFFADLLGHTPKEVVRAIEVRAFHNITRAGRALQINHLLANPVSRRSFPTARCVADASNTCRAGKRLHGKVVPASERIAFPLPGCTSEWCACSCDLQYKGRGA